MNRIKKFIRDRICASWERTIGPVSILVCDLSLSINLLRKLSTAEKNECQKCDVLDTSNISSVRMPTYGITIEPFAINLMGSDGDVCWSSPGWYLVNWVFSADTFEPSSSVPEESLFGFNLGV